MGRSGHRPMTPSPKNLLLLKLQEIHPWIIYRIKAKERNRNGREERKKKKKTKEQSEIKERGREKSKIRVLGGEDHGFEGEGW